MKNIKKNRLLTFLMWLVPISMCGFHWTAVWIVIQLMLYQSEKKEHERRKVPIWEDEKIIELNKDIKLDENYEGLIKIGEGKYFYQRKR